jgi:Phosphodiester glycosidase
MSLRARRFRFVAISSALALSLAAAATASPHRPVAEASMRRSSNRVARGVKLIRVAMSSGPVAVYELRIDPSQESTLDVAMPGHTLGSYARVSTMAQAHNAIAAVNGDYSRNGRPLHAFAQDGDIVQTGIHGAGNGFGTSADETRTYAGHPAVRISGRVKSSGLDIEVDEWNSGDPSGGEINGFSEVGGSAGNPPGGACSARLLPNGPMGWGQGGKVARDYTVDNVGCGADSMGLQGGIVLSADAGGTQAQKVKSLARGDEIRLTWTFGYPQMMDWIGGQPDIIRNGNIVAPNNCGYICARQPRTAVGATENGTILMVVVDGRNAGYSVGLTLVQLAHFMKREGAVRAVNLDGGGSAEMWVKGNIVNRPSDGGERPVTNSLILLPHGDAQEPKMAKLARPIAASPVAETAVSPDEAAQAWSLASTDPGSTGGLLYAMARGQLGPAPRLDPALQAAADGFARSVGR